MAIYKEDIVDINLETGNIHRSFLAHSIGYLDQKADHFGVRVFRGKDPVDLTGVSVQGIFMPPQGSPIAITSGNSVSGNVAYVVLPQACYNYNGQFCLAIKLVDSNNSITGTVRIVDGMVDNTHASGTVAPTSAVPTYQEILSTYDAMVAATAAANGCIAATYSSSATYKVGDYCIHDGGLYSCITAITTAEVWTSGHWTAAKIGPDVSDLKSAFNYDIEQEFSKEITFVPTSGGSFGIISGGVKYSDGQDNTATNRVRTKYFNIEPGKTYRFDLTDSTYKIINMWTYNAALHATGISHDTDWSESQRYIFTAGTGANCCRVTFGYASDDSHTMTDADKTAILAAVHLYEQTDNVELVGRRTTIIENATYTPIGYYIDSTGCIKWTDGTVVSSTTYSHTDYIDVSAWDKIRYSRAKAIGASPNQGIAFYDGTRTYISGIPNKPNQEANGYEYNICDVPAGAVYAMFSVLVDEETYGKFEIYGVTPLKTKLDGIEESVTKYRHAYDFNYWSQGTITPASGETADSSAICRSGVFIRFLNAINGNVIFHVKSGFQIRFYEYTSNNTSTYTLYYSSFTQGTGTFIKQIDPEKYYRITIRYEGGTPDLPKADIPEDAVWWEYDTKYKKRDYNPTATSTATKPWSTFEVKINIGWPDESLTTTGNAESGTEHTTTCALVLPYTYDPAKKPTPLIMFAHGHSCGVSKTTWYANNSNFLAMIQAFREAGYAIFDVDNTRGKASGFGDWGCLPLMESYIKAWQYVKENYNVTDKLWLVSDSMGTAASLQMLKWYADDIVCAVQTAPRPLTGAERYPTASDSHKKEILVAFGLEPDSILDDSSYVIPESSVFDGKFDGFRNYSKIVTIGETPMILKQFPPLKVMVGKSDTDFLTEVREYYTALKNTGNYVDYREVTGADHAVMSFLSQGSLKQECIDFLNRFRN